MTQTIVTASAEALVAELLGHQERAVIIESPAVLVGLKRFDVDEVFENHFHRSYDEYFAVITGELVVWQYRGSRVELGSGESLLCRRGTHHMLVNESGHEATLLYAKTPFVADDTEWVIWNPEPH